MTPEELMKKGFKTIDWKGLAKAWADEDKERGREDWMDFIKQIRLATLNEVLEVMPKDSELKDVTDPNNVAGISFNMGFREALFLFKEKIKGLK